MSEDTNAPVLELVPPAVKRPKRRKKAVAIDLGLRQRVPGCEETLLALMCSTDVNNDMFFVHELDVAVRRGAPTVFCSGCRQRHELLTVNQAVGLNWIGDRGGEELVAIVTHETLLLNQAALFQRAAKGRGALAGEVLPSVRDAVSA